MSSKPKMLPRTKLLFVCLGFICCEGPEEEVENLWKQIRALRWQKISVIEKEFPIPQPLFNLFEELSVDNSKFVQFLKDRELSRVIRDYLGMKS